mmetsp:Transcript_39241/g.61757  ORF Transcript_39241/g.61757 Transcript_39241/m.61757 type:complete len:239 (+) Transcript_39241:529-1245(+)
MLVGDPQRSQRRARWHLTNLDLQVHLLPLRWTSQFQEHLQEKLRHCNWWRGSGTSSTSFGRSWRRPRTRRRGPPSHHLGWRSSPRCIATVWPRGRCGCGLRSLRTSAELLHRDFWHLAHQIEQGGRGGRRGRFQGRQRYRRGHGACAGLVGGGLLLQAIAVEDQQLGFVLGGLRCWPFVGSHGWALHGVAIDPGHGFHVGESPNALVQVADGMVDCAQVLEVAHVALPRAAHVVPHLL